MSDQDINLEHVIKFLSDQIASQAHEIAVLKANIVALLEEKNKV